MKIFAPTSGTSVHDLDASAAVANDTFERSHEGAATTVLRIVTMFERTPSPSPADEIVV